MTEGNDKHCTGKGEDTRYTIGRSTKTGMEARQSGPASVQGRQRTNPSREEQDPRYTEGSHDGSAPVKDGVEVADGLSESNVVPDRG